MDAKSLWDLFMKTGSPEVYLLYKEITRESVPATA